MSSCLPPPSVSPSHDLRYQKGSVPSPHLTPKLRSEPGWALAFGNKRVGFVFRSGMGGCRAQTPNSSGDSLSQGCRGPAPFGFTASEPASATLELGELRWCIFSAALGLGSGRGRGAQRWVPDRCPRVAAPASL